MTQSLGQLIEDIQKLSGDMNHVNKCMCAPGTNRKLSLMQATYIMNSAIDAIQYRAGILRDMIQPYNGDF